jgi:hypothetical protein
LNTLFEILKSIETVNPNIIINTNILI